MKHTLFIFALITASIQTFAQSPRIKLNQITKDSVTGSVLISSPTDSGMVYSRDLFISYGADTVLILGGDTLAATSGIISSVLSDGVTITGDGTLGSELTADTSVLATLRALSDSLALVISSVTADGVTITGDGTVGSPLTVDTTTYIATKQDLDLYYLDSNPDGYTSNTGTVTSVGATAGTGISVSGSPITTSGTLTITNTAPDQTVSIAGGGINAVTGTYPSFTVTGTEVDGSVTNEIQDISTTGAAGNISISSGSTLNLNVDDSDASATNEGSLTVGAGTASTSVISSNTSGSTDVTLTAGTNVTLSETGNNITISSTGGGTTYNNISETADTVYIDSYLNVDNGTLYVDSFNNRVGIGTTSPSAKFHVQATTGSEPTMLFRGANASVGAYVAFDRSDVGEYSNAGILYRDFETNTNRWYLTNYGKNMPTNFNNAISFLQFTDTSGVSILKHRLTMYDNGDVAIGGMTNGLTGANVVFKGTGNVGIGTTSPQAPLSVAGPIHMLDVDQTSFSDNNIYVYNDTDAGSTGGATDAEFAFFVAKKGSSSNSQGPNFILRGNDYTRNANSRGGVFFNAGTVTSPTGFDGTINFYTNSQLKMQIEADGDVYFTNDISAADVVDRSDVRLKENIYEYQNGLNDIMQLNPVYFNLIDNNRKRLGFIAQDVREVIPEAVTGEEDKEFLGISYSSFSAALTKAIQEQQAIIDQQATEIEELKTLITDLSNRLTILENN